MINRIYLGDRSVTGLEINSRDSQVRIRINLISRLPEISSDWDFYDAEDIIDGFLVFSGVYYLEVSPAGIIPGDYIIDYELTEKKGTGEFIIKTVGQPNNIYKANEESIIKIRFHDSWIENRNKKLVI